MSAPSCSLHGEGRRATGWTLLLTLTAASFTSCGKLLMMILVASAARLPLLGARGAAAAAPGAARAGARALLARGAVPEYLSRALPAALGLLAPPEPRAGRGLDSRLALMSSSRGLSMSIFAVWEDARMGKGEEYEVIGTGTGER